jgi:hypothetical protein
MADSARAAPWHLWAVAVVGIACVDRLSVWMTAIRAIGVWGALLGTLLLLLRNRLAAPVFAVSLAAYGVSLLDSHFLSDGAQVMGDMAFLQWIVLSGWLFFACCSRLGVRAGYLR